MKSGPSVNVSAGSYLNHKMGIESPEISAHHKFPTDDHIEQISFAVPTARFLGYILWDRIS